MAGAPTASPAEISGRADYTVDQGWEGYGEEDHAIWRRLYERQAKLLPRRACGEYLRGLAQLGVAAAGIPDFRRLSDILEPATGWRIVAVPGLVPDAVFFAHLAARRFPATNWIRAAGQLDYLEEARRLPRCPRPRAAAHPPGLRRLYGGLWPRRPEGGAPWGTEEPGPALLVHGGVRPDPPRGGLAHLRRRSSSPPSPRPATAWRIRSPGASPSISPGSCAPTTASTASRTLTS